MNKIKEIFFGIMHFYLGGYDQSECTADIIANEALNSHQVIFNITSNHYGS